MPCGKRVGVQRSITLPACSSDVIRESLAVFLSWYTLYTHIPRHDESYYDDFVDDTATSIVQSKSDNPTEHENTLFNAFIMALVFQHRRILNRCFLNKLCRFGCLQKWHLNVKWQESVCLRSNVVCSQHCTGHMHRQRVNIQMSDDTTRLKTGQNNR